MLLPVYSKMKASKGKQRYVLFVFVVLDSVVFFAVVAGVMQQVCKSKSLATLVGLVKTVWKLIEDVEGDRAAGENSHSAQGEEGVEGGGVPTKSDSGAAASSSAGSEQHCSEAMSGALAEDGGGGAVTASSDIRRGGISRSQIDTWEKEEVWAAVVSCGMRGARTCIMITDNCVDSPLHVSTRAAGEQVGRQTKGRRDEHIQHHIRR